MRTSPRHPARRMLALAAALGTTLALAPPAQAAASPSNARAAASADVVVTLSIPDHTTGDERLTGTVKVQAPDGTEGVVQLAVDGGPVGTPVPVTVSDGVASTPVDLAARAPGEHVLRSTYTAADGETAHAEAAWTVVPASLPWTLTYSDGSKVGWMLAHPDTVVSGSGQIPGSTVLVETRPLGGAWSTAHAVTAGADGEFTMSTPLFHWAAARTTYQVRTRVETPWGDVTGAARTVVVPDLEHHILLEVADPGAFRAGANIRCEVRLSHSWLGTELFVSDGYDYEMLIEEDAIQVLIDGRQLEMYTFSTYDGPGDWNTFDVRVPLLTRGAHTVQVRLEATYQGFYGLSPVRTFAVAPAGFTLRTEVSGSRVTKVAAGSGVDLVADGLLPGTAVAFTLDGEPLGTATVPEAGTTAGAPGLERVVLAVTLPAGTATGAHTLTATATDPLGDTLVATRNLTVTAAAVPPPTATPSPDPTAGPAPTPAPRTPDLAASGSGPATLGLLAGALTLAGGLLLLVARRRAVRD